ncbi:MAG: hypothetical protein EON58_23300, partial [Alphaproteobacteria bacterium]
MTQPRCSRHGRSRRPVRIGLHILKIRDLRTQSGIIPRLTVRWLMIAAATIFAFWPTWTNLWR